jgi:hypothetical protein
VMLNLKGTNEGHYNLPYTLVASNPCSRQLKNQNEGVDYERQKALKGIAV